MSLKDPWLWLSEENNGMTLDEREGEVVREARRAEAAREQFGLRLGGREPDAGTP